MKGILTLTDFYKTDHRRQYPEGTGLVYSNITPRMSRIDGINKVVVFGIQYLIKEYLIKQFNEKFFSRPKDEVISEYKRRLDNALGVDSVPMDHIEALHNLGYLPIKIKALPEGTLCPIKTPFLTIVNTNPKFFWVTNFLETLICNMLWLPMTSATIAKKYHDLLNAYAIETSDNNGFVQFQGHDFSMRGMCGIEACKISGGGHLLSFVGTDTIPAIDFLEDYYNADSDKELIGCSVPATEHSVMCMGTEEKEIDTYRRLITKVYPKGIVSIVSDTWDFWKIVTEYVSELKDVILGRDGKVVIRPDSGDPLKILCGDQMAKKGSPEHKGTIECLWDVFGGTVNSKGYKELDSHIGAIYGDAITLDRCDRICKMLKEKGFASTNIVFGIGSYTYQYNTRDTFGFAMKSTFGVINGKPIEIFKDPVTDTGFKKSAKGLIRVNQDLTYTDQVNQDEEKTGELKEIFKNGELLIDQSLSEIRSRLNDNPDRL
jgi:nicotinamide phosphoribosyltransferase